MTDETQDGAVQTLMPVLGSSLTWSTISPVLDHLTQNDGYTLGTPSITNQKSFFETYLALTTDGLNYGFNYFDFSFLSSNFPTSDTDAYASYTFDNYSFGYELTPDQVNSSNFGVAWGCSWTNLFGGGIEGYSDNLTVSDFGFSIPSYAKITHVTIEIDRFAQYSARTNQTTARVDHIRATVTYQYWATLKRWEGSSWVDEGIQVYLTGFQTKPLKVFLQNDWRLVDTTP